MISVLGTIFSSIRNSFIDLFSSRSNTTGGLGIATDGSNWVPVNGTINVTSGAAKATTIPSVSGAGSTYPMAIQNMPNQNVTISLRNTNQGSGIALWVQSSTDWWVVDATANQTSTTVFTSNSFTSFTSGVNSWSVYYTASPTSSATRFTSSGQVVFSGGAPVYQVSYSSGTVFSGGASGPPLFTGNTTWTSASGTNFTSGTAFSFAQFLRIKQSVSSVVSQISSATLSTAQTIASLRVILSGNTIRARGYSDNNFVTQMGSDLVHTATGATINTRYGISLSPSTFSQSDIIGTSIEIS